jgi:hypothetical protein
MKSSPHVQTSAAPVRPSCGGPHYPLASGEPAAQLSPPSRPRGWLAGRIRRAVQWATIGLFGLVLVAPTIQKRCQLISCPEVDENRTKQPRPKASLAEIWLNRNNAAVDYEKYYNDHYGLRDLFIRVKNQVDYSVFAKSDKVHIGPGGWLFYRTVLDTQQVNLERTSPDDEKKLFRAVDRLAEVLKQRGITLIVMPCPQKNTIYPELVPSSAPRRPETTFFARYRAFLNAHPQIVFIDATEILAELKKQRDVFYRTDFHWTDVAAYFVGREAIGRIGRREGSVPVYHQLQLRSEIYSGGQAMFIPMLWTPKETANFPEKNWKDDGDCQSNVGPYDWIYRRRDGQGLPALVVYGDSFFDGMVRNGFHTYFKEVHRAVCRLQPFAKVLAALPPQTKYLLVEHIEVATAGLWLNLPPL